MEIVQIGFTREEGRVLDRIINMGWERMETTDPDIIPLLQDVQNKVLTAAKLFRDHDELASALNELRKGDQS